MATGSEAETRKQRIAQLVLKAVAARLPEGGFDQLAERLSNPEPRVALDPKALGKVAAAHAGRRQHSAPVKPADIERMREDLAESTGAAAFLSDWTRTRGPEVTAALASQRRLNWVVDVVSVLDEVLEHERQAVLDAPDLGHSKGVYLLGLAFDRRLKDVNSNDTRWAVESLASPRRAADHLMNELRDDLGGVIIGQEHLSHATQSRITAVEREDSHLRQMRTDHRLVKALQHAWSEVLSSPEGSEAVAYLGAQQTSPADTASSVCRIAGGIAAMRTQRIA